MGAHVDRSDRPSHATRIERLRNNRWLIAGAVVGAVIGGFWQDRHGGVRRNYALILTAWGFAGACAATRRPCGSC